jgi:proteasome lid subunit RPN8/RPN11
VKYKGKKLDIYKSAWFRKTKAKEAEAKKDVLTEENEDVRAEDETDAEEGVKTPAGKDKKRKIVKHSSLGHRSLDHDFNTLVECTTFSALGKIQPFTVTITTTCLLLVDYHCHLTSGEVVGYLAGSWDVDSHNLAIQRAFPCRCRLADKNGAVRVEEEIREQLEKANLSLVGWYHSHPHASCNPSIRDITSQMSYQMQLKGESASSYTPCIGLICAPYFKEGSTSESSMQTYWVMPPPENRPQDFGKPMLMNYGIVHDIILSQDMLTEMRVLHDYYKPAPDIIDFTEKWKDDVTYMDKLLSSLSRKCPGEQSDVQLAEFVQNLILPS